MDPTVVGDRRRRCCSARDLAARFTAGLLRQLPRRRAIHWIDINGPYNEHFIRDFGALNAALVVVIVFALWKRDATSLVQAAGSRIGRRTRLPHAIYHLAHLDVYKSSEKVIAVAPLVLQIVMGVAIAVAG